MSSTVSPVVRRNAGNAATADGAPKAGASDGPDLSVGDQPPAVVEAVLPATAAADFNSADVCIDVFRCDVSVPIYVFCHL